MDQSVDSLDDPDLPALISAAMEMRDQGIEPPLAEICRARPDLIEAVAHALEASRRLPFLQQASAGRDSHVGRVLGGRYRLEQRLGSGAMGVVYRAEDIELRRPVAVKILRSLLIDGHEAEYRFEREAESMAAIRHQAVITVHDRGRTVDDDAYLVLELLEGRSLSELLDVASRKGPEVQDASWIARELDADPAGDPSFLRRAVAWAAELASGLSATHEKGIFHRDVKPSNVFVCRDGRIVLLDFGIAARMDHETITRDGAAVGTPAYMAPESLDRGTSPGASLDIYSLSATLYHTLTLRPPYNGTPSQIISSLAAEDPPPASRLRHGLPRDLQAILDKGMARDPGHRYRTAADLESDLRAFLEHRSIDARPLSPFVRTWRRLRRSPVARTLAVLTLLALVAGIVKVRLDGARHQRELAYNEAMAQLPPNLTIVRPESRVLAVGQEHVPALLEAVVASAEEALPASLLRAAFRLDRGDLEGARADMQRVAGAVGTPFARELAARYERLPEDASSALLLDLDDLPEPEGADDLYLQAYHLMRAFRRGEVLGVLGDERLEGHLLAEQLAILFLGRTPVEMYERTLALEGRLGLRTATTANLLASSLVLQERHAHGLEIAREGLALAPRSVSLLMNAGRAAWMLGDLEEAREAYVECTRLDPGYWRPHEFLVRVLIEDWRTEAASAALASAPFEEDGAPTTLRSQLAGEIETERALRYAHDGEDRLRDAAVEAALGHFDEVLAVDESYGSARMSIALALADGEEHDVFTGLVDLARDSGLTRRRLEILLDWMPDDLDPAASKAMRGLLERLSERPEEYLGDPR